MADQKITFIFDAINKVSPSVSDIKKSVESIQKSVADVNSNLATLKTTQSAAVSGFSKFASAASSVGTSLTAVAAGLFVAYKSFQILIDAASEQEAAVNQLNTALKLSGTFTEANSQSFQDLATQLQSTTVVSDDLALSMFALSKNFGATDKQAKQIVQVAADMSAALGIDLETAVTQLSASLNGSIGRLGKLNPELKGLSQSALESGKAIEILGNQFNGAAAAKVNTFSGSLQVLKNSFGEILEELGNFVIKSDSAARSFVFLSELFKNAAANVAGFRKELNLSDQEKQIRETAELQRSQIEDNTDRFAAYYQFQRIENAKVQKQGFEDAMQRYDSEVLLAKQAAEEKQKVEEINAKKLLEVQKSLAPQYEALAKSLQFTGASPVEKVQQETKEQQDLLKKSLDSRLLDQKKYTELSIKLEQKSFDERFKAVKESVDKENKVNEERERKSRESIERIAKIQEQLRNVGSTAVQDPFEALKTGPKLDLTDSEKKKFKTEVDASVNLNIAGAAVGFVKEINKGAEGAKVLLSKGVAAAADLFLPGIGPVVGELFNVLAGGPEQVKAMVTQFVEAVPTIIQGVLEALPVLIEALSTELPKVFLVLIDQADEIVLALTTGLLHAAPSIAQGLSLQMPKVAIALAGEAPYIALSFSQALISEAPTIVASIVSGLFDGIKGIFENLNPFGGGAGNFLGGLPLIGGLFAEGGTPQVKRVPGTGTSDSVLSGLTPGELVIDRSTTVQLQDFLDERDQNNNGNNDLTNSLLLQIVALLQRDQSVETKVNFNQKTLADIMINLSRTGARTA